MRIHCKVVVIAVCFGVFLLLYFLGGNAADDPLLKEVGEEPEEDSSSSQSPSLLEHNVVAKFPRKSPAGVGVRPEEPLKGRKQGRPISRGATRPVTRRTKAEDVMHLAVVACGNRLNETLTMVKSALLFSLKKIKFHIFAEDPLALQFKERWPRSVAAKFQYRIYSISFSVGNADEWKKLFKPCAAQRLFLPVSLTHLSHLISPPCLMSLAGVKKKISGSSLTTTTASSLSTCVSQSSYKSLPVSKWMRYLKEKTYLRFLSVYEQQVLCFRLFIFPCQWNYRPDHCMYGSNCKGAEEEGVSILHGNRGVYHDDKQPAFKVVYDAIHNFPFEDNMFQSLFYPIQTKFLDTVNTLCGRIPQVFLKQIEKTMRKVFEDKVYVSGLNFDLAIKTP
uniref:Glucoside xylosyltransferase 2 n=1 Tax=Neolamprologus brichardi TaxID=32507 RepID=A0A3Q4I911_NEOBR